MPIMNGVRSPNPDAGHYELPRPWVEAITGWLTWLAAAGTTTATRRTRRSHLRSTARRLGTHTPADVTTRDLVEILASPTHSPEHRRGLRSSLASFYRWAAANGVADDISVDLPTVRAVTAAPRPATDEVWLKLLDTAEPRVRLMARLAGEAGMRRAEVAQLHTNDLVGSIESPDLIVRGKGNKQRVVPITAGLAMKIRTACPDGGYVFPGQVDGHMSPDRVGRLVSEAMGPGWSMHKLRHRYATRGYMATRNLRAVQEALGHSSVATTQRYTAVSDAEIRAVSEAACGRR